MCLRLFVILPAFGLMFYGVPIVDVCDQAMLANIVEQRKKEYADLEREEEARQAKRKKFKEVRYDI
jgi:hypothetical protein